MSEPIDPKAERYLRGEMSTAELREFEFRLSYDQRLRDELTRAADAHWNLEDLRPTPSFRSDVRRRLNAPIRAAGRSARLWGSITSSVAALLLMVFAAGNLLEPPARSTVAPSAPEMIYTSDYDTGEWPALAQSWWHTLGAHPLQSIYDDEASQMQHRTRRLTDLEPMPPLGLPWQPFQP